MSLKNISKREKKLFYVGVAAIVCIIAYVFIFEPIWTNWQTLNKSISAKELKLIKNLRIVAQSDIIAELYDKYAADIRMKGSEQEETAVILREIENIARASNTYISDIKPHKIKDMEFYKEYFVELEAEGDIQNLTKFIYDLQNSKQILKVRYLRLNPKGDSSDMLKGYMIVTKILIP